MKDIILEVSFIFSTASIIILLFIVAPMLKELRTKNATN